MSHTALLLVNLPKSIPRFVISELQAFVVSENLKNYRDNLAKTLQAWCNLLRSIHGYYLPRR